MVEHQGAGGVARATLWDGRPRPSDCRKRLGNWPNSSGCKGLQPSKSITALSKSIRPSKSGTAFARAYDQDVVSNAFESDGIQASRGANRFRSYSSDARLVSSGKDRGDETPNFVDQIQIEQLSQSIASAFY